MDRLRQPVWCGFQHHFIGECRFHLATFIGDRLVSTVGDYRPPVILDPFAGSGTTLAVALGHNPDALAIGIDLDERNEVLARDRVGPLLWGDTKEVR